MTPAVTVDAAYLDAAGPQLRIVANYAVGIDNIDLEAARARGVVVSNTPGVLTNATAEHAIGLMLALLRRIAEGDRSLRRRDQWEWGPDFMVGEGLEGKELLVVGPGRIGRRVAELAEAHGAACVSPVAVTTRPRLLASCGRRQPPLPAHSRDASSRRRRRARGDEADGGAREHGARDRSSTRQRSSSRSARHRSPAPRSTSSSTSRRCSEELLAMENVVAHAAHRERDARDARRAMGMLCVSALRAVLLEGRTPANAV